MTDTNPDYYKSDSMEAIDVIEAFSLDFCLGNTVKYVLRNGKKDASVLELKKARWYLTRRLEQLGEPTGYDAAHEAKDEQKRLATLQGTFIEGFKAAYKHLGLRFNT